MSEGSAFAGISTGSNSQKVFKYRDTQMCNKWNSYDENYKMCKFKVANNPYGNFKVSGSIKDLLLKVGTTTEIYAKYWASNKPTYCQSYTGSGIPFPNEKLAFEGTENKGLIRISNNRFEIILDYPNSYYTDFGIKYVPPQVNIKFVDGNDQDISKVYTIKLGNGLPFRSQSWTKKRDWNKGPMFYYNPDLPTRTQEQILIDSAYPCTNQEPANFWGLTPPC